MVLFGHSICLKDFFGRVCAACYAWPTCPAAGRVSNPAKSPHQSRSVSTQPCRAGGMCLGGSSVEGSQGGARHAVFPDSPEIPAGGRDSLWAHLYFNYFSDCSLRRAMAGGQIQQHRSGFSLQLPRILSTGWAGCCVCPAPGRARAT